MDESRLHSSDIDIMTGKPLMGFDTPAVTEEPLFVINLCASMTPIDVQAQRLAGVEQYKLYQVSRIEDGRRRYRLRLGFFATESQAEEVLSSVRSNFATAFTSCLVEEDLKHATGYLKCTVDDLQRTGRYSVRKLRGDTGATTTVRALSDTARIRLEHTATTATVAVVPTVKIPIIGAATQPSNGDAATTVRIPALGTAAQTPPQSKPRIVGSLTPRKPEPKPSLAAQLFIAKGKQAALGGEPPPKRVSLMRQAQAMADTDTAARAKAVAHLPGNGPDVDKPVSQPSRNKVTPLPATQPLANATAKNTTKPKAPTPPIAAPTPPTQRRDQPFHVGAGIDIPQTGLELASEAPAAQRPAPHAAPTTKQVIAPTAISTVLDTDSTTDLLRARELAKQSAQWRQDNSETPTLDTTQTIRTLTKKELEDLNAQKWFVVQLAVSSQPANLDTMPRLDIFEAYTLYSVAVMDNGGIKHALRLGFFREEVSAEAVMGYLRTFFHEPVITRIPDAEQQRFANTPKIIPPIKAPTSVVTIEDKNAAAIPTVNTAVARSPNHGAGGARPMAREATPAAKHGAMPKSERRAAPRAKASNDPQQQLLDEARLLGLSETQRLRVQKNPSLLSRLVGKLGK